MRKPKVISLFSLIILLSVVFQTIPAAIAQVPDINDKIRKEGMDNSQIMKTLHYLTDVYGPRLTGSPNHVAAANWAVKRMKDWGFDDAKLEEWDFGHPGWLNERAVGVMTAPNKDNLTFEVLAWTPSTSGTVSGEAFNLILPDRPTQEELTAYLNSIAAKVKGKMVLVGKPAVIPVNITPPPKRRADDEVRKQVDPNNTTPQGPPFTPQPQPSPRPGQLTGQQIGEQLDKFLVDNGVLVRINDAGREHGQIRAFHNRTFDITKNVPTVVMRNEDFGRIARILDDGTAVSLEFNIKNNSYPEGTTSYNTIGELWGSDKKDEVIMLGGHLDSWHSATGATDNAIGCSIMMEAVRILKALGVKPRRTIRVALWSGEEQGLLGSQAYVKKHFGSFEAPTAEYEKFGGYFNIDSGTGRARALSVFGTPETAAVLREIVKPFEEYGIFGATSSSSRRTGGSDHTSFNQAGLPGIGVGQDPIEYGTHTWHTNLDTYERIIEDDVKKDAVIMAAAVYQLAMRDELLPRYSKENMPKLPN
jgi:carboxypeptidase Q